MSRVANNLPLVTLVYTVYNFFMLEFVVVIAHWCFGDTHMQGKAALEQFVKVTFAKTLAP